MSKRLRLFAGMLTVFLLALMPAVVPIGTSVSPAAASTTVSATGGSCQQTVGNTAGVTVTRDGNDCVVRFTNVGSTTWTPPTGVTAARVLVVAGGGGGGGRNWGGGGGGGGVLQNTGVGLTPGSPISVSVGGGGAGGANVESVSNRGTNGGPSLFGAASAPGGGGGGGTGWDNPDWTGAGNAGGSGGGGGEHGNDAERNGRLLYEVVKPRRDGNNVEYSVNNSGAFGPAAITRVTYYMQVRIDNTLRWAEVTFDPWRSNLTAQDLRVPDLGAGRFAVQEVVSNMIIDSNMPAVAGSRGVTTSGAPRTAFRGYLELWPWNYGPGGTAGADSSGDSRPIGNNDLFDFNDSQAGRDTYGSFQVHNIGPANQQTVFNPQTVFAWNHHSSSNPEVGLGTQNRDHPDWTFSAGQGTSDWSLQIRANKNQFQSLPGGLPTTIAPFGWTAHGNQGGPVNVLGSQAGSGGGGAGSVGSAVPRTSYQSIDGVPLNRVAGNGGAGLSSSITGSSVFYAVGGGGATVSDESTCSTGGTGGGGGGACGTGSGTAGLASTGGGGGGGHGERTGASGGSGVVVVRYTLAAQASLSFVNPPASIARGASAALSVTGGSGSGAVSFSYVSGPCAVSGSQVTALNTSGTCVVRATKAEDPGFLMSSVDVSFPVRANDTISFTNPGATAYSSNAFSLSAVGSSGRTVSFDSTTPLVCTVVLSTGILTMLRDGTCSVRASWPDDGTFFAAESTIQFVISKAAQDITFTNPGTRTFASGAFTVGASATSGLAVTFSSQTPSVCSVSGTSVTTTAAGTCTVRASQPGNDTQFNAATLVDQSFEIAKATQTISFTSTAPIGPVRGTRYSPTATATSGLSVSFTVTAGGGSVCSLGPDGVVEFLRSGLCVVVANQAGNSNFLVAPQVMQEVTAGLISQTITFDPLTARTYGDAAFTVAATASSELPVAFASSTVSVCTVLGVSVTIVSVGTCTITATQAGDSSFAAASSVSQSFVVAKRPITMIVNIANRQWDNTRGATVSGAPTLVGVLLADVGFVAVDASEITGTFDTAAVGDGKAVAVSLAAGVLTAGSFGDRSDRYVVTVSVSPVANITKATQAALSIAVTNAALVFGGTATLSSTGGSGTGTVVFTVVSGDCTITAGTTVTASGGTTDCVVRAVKETDANFLPISAADLLIAVSKAAQTITFTSTAPISPVRGDRYSPVVTANSALPVVLSITVGDGNVCSLGTDGVVEFLRSGLCVIVANQAGDSNFLVAPQVTQTVTAGLISQTITFDPLTGRTYGDAAFTVAALAVSSSSSQLPVAFGSSTVSVCTVSGVSVTIVSAGTCTITATQAGDSSFATATSESRSFVVAKMPITMIVNIANRQWDNTRDATVSEAPTLTGLLLADVGFVAVNGSKVTALFDTAAVGNGKAVAVSLAAGVLTAGSFGDRSGNYVVTVSGAPTANITKATQAALTILFNGDPDPDAALVFGDTATLSSTGGSGTGAVVFTVFSGDCTITAGTTVTASGGTVNCVVRAVKETDTNYLPIFATSDLLIAVSKAAQTITFTSTAPISPVRGDRYSPVVTANSALPVVLSITVGDGSVCSLGLDGVVTFATSGTCVIAANQAGNANFLVASQVTQTVTAGLISQTITFDPLTARTYGDAAFTVAALAVSASSSQPSQLPVAFGSSTVSVCTISGDSVTIVSAGTCVITATQGGDSSFAAASSVSQSFVVAKMPITMIVNIANRQWDNTRGATVSGAPTLTGLLLADVGFVAVNGSKVTALFDTAAVGNGKSVAVSLAVGVLTGDRSGNYVVTVSGAPTANITKATQAALSIAVTNAALVFGGTATLSSTGGSGTGAVVFTVFSGDCTITAGTTVTASGGTNNCVVTAVKGTDSNYLPISAANLSITVSKAAQSALSIAVNAGNSAALVFGDSATLSSSGGSGTGAVLFSVVSGDCMITGVTAGTMVTASGGTTDCVVTAVKQADRNYVQVSAGSTVAIVVSKATQVLTFTSSMPVSVVVGARHTPVAVTSAGFSAPVNVTAGEREVCSLSGGVVVFVGAGSCVVTVSQAGTRNFAAAASVGHTIVVREAPVSIPIVPPPSTNPVSRAPVSTAPIAPTSPTAPTVQPALLGPIMTAGRSVDINAGSQATIGGVPTRVIAAPNGFGGATMQAGVLQFDISPTNPSTAGGASFASIGPSRSLGLSVAAGQSTTMVGGGALPGSMLQLWLPGQGAGAGAGAGVDHRELARLSVAADGSFRGDVSFTANRSEVPLPIGRQMMQATGFDQNGNQVVVDMVINIAQGAPQPERIRSTNDLPAMDAGELLATSAGVAETVAIEVRAERGEVAVVSESWQFLLTVSANTGTVASRGGGALVEVAQSGVATVSGSDFQPETRVDMWLFSEPTLLGSVVVDADGTFTTEFSLDARFATLGAHTLQLQGVGVDGFVKAANLGVSVVDGDAAGAGATAFAGWWMWVLTVAALIVALTLTLVFVRRRSSGARLQGDVASWGTRVGGTLRL